MTQGQRFHSIDIMKGILILLMLFVNNHFLPNLPPWLSTVDPGNNSWGIPGWVFPGFLFMFGMTVPFMVSKKINENFSINEIIRHIFARTIILLAIGVLMVNINRVNHELTGFGKDLWALLMYLAVFLVWNRYQEKENNFFTFIGLKFIGLAIIIFLIFRFRSGSFENNGSLITGWWDIPGLLGWGFLVSSFTFLAFRNSIIGTFLIWSAFLSLNIFAQLKLTEFLNQFRPYLGIIIDGHIPLILLSGHLAGLVLKRFSASDYKKIIFILSVISLIMVLTGFFLRKWIFTTRISGNPGIALICCGMTLLIFILIYWFADIRKNDRWFVFLKPAGENALTTYIFPNIIYHLIWISGLPVLFYQNSGNIFINNLGSALWAIIMIWLTSVLIRLTIRLKI
jgi:heparan-alpha-glucosaminide N-acetyltransferase